MIKLFYKNVCCQNNRQTSVTKTLPATLIERKKYFEIKKTRIRPKMFV